MRTREQEVVDGLRRVRERVVAACAGAGRDPDDVTVVVVTKYFGAPDLRLLAHHGVRDLGENKHQEAVAKAEELVDLGVRWHFVGGLQSNKAAAVARYADVVHSVDRGKVLTGLSRGAVERDRDLDVLLQVSLDPPAAGEGRAGAAPQELPALAERVAGAERLRLRGVMAVAPRDGDPAAAFERLAAISADLRAEHPSADWISAGMSGDLEQALAHGATHLRVGSAVLGPRPASK